MTNRVVTSAALMDIGFDGFFCSGYQVGMDVSVALTGDDQFFAGFGICQRHIHIPERRRMQGFQDHIRLDMDL